MASVTRTAHGYRVQVYVKGMRDSATFRTRREAEAWGARRETELREGAAKPPGEKHTLGDGLRRYSEEVSVTKRGKRWEQIRIEAFIASPDLPIASPIGEVNSDTIGKWRDARLQQVSAGTVLRELGVLSAFFECARREWKWIPANPVQDVRKPRAPDHREVLLTRPQIKAMLKQLGYSPRQRVVSISQSVAVAFLLALRSGMRAGEICGLTWDRVFEDYCETPHKTGKTATSLREVPLSKKAMLVIGKMRGFDARQVFGLKPQTLDALFRRARDRAGLAGFVFHDARHTAATWMAQQVDVLTLCKIFGWTNTAQALTYYNPKASDIAKRL